MLVHPCILRETLCHHRLRILRLIFGTLIGSAAAAILSYPSASGRHSRDSLAAKKKRQPCCLLHWHAQKRRFRDRRNDFMRFFHSASMWNPESFRRGFESNAWRRSTMITSSPNRFPLDSPDDPAILSFCKNLAIIIFPADIAAKARGSGQQPLSQVCARPRFVPVRR